MYTYMTTIQMNYVKHSRTMYIYIYYIYKYNTHISVQEYSVLYVGNR